MSDKSMWIELPRSVLRDHDVLDDLSAVIDKLYLSGNPLLIASSSPDRIVGDRVRGQLGDTMSILLDHASFESVERVVDAARETGVGYLIALGGDEPIDMAKMASDRLDCGSILIPTTTSHDGVVSSRSSILEGDTRHLIAVDLPLAIVANTELLAEAPWELTTAGCTNIISNYIVVKDWEFAHRPKNVEYSEYAGVLSRMIAEMLADSADSIKPGLEESAWIVTKALVSSDVAMSIADSSWPAPGAERLFSRQLDRIAPGSVLHGRQVGVGSIMTEYLHSGTCDKWTDIRDALSTTGMPTAAGGLDIDDETIIEALTTAHEIRDRYTILGNGISERAAIETATTTGVI